MRPINLLLLGLIVASILGPFQLKRMRLKVIKNLRHRLAGKNEKNPI